MGVYVEVKGGQPNYKHVERWFNKGDDVISYLGEWMGSKSVEKVEGKSFLARGQTITLSHDIKLIRAHRDTIVPDNELSDAVKERMTAARGAKLPASAASASSANGKHAPASSSRKLKDAPPANDDAEPSPAKATKQQANAKPAAAATGKVVVLKDICRQIDMEPRVARQKLRKAYEGNDKQRWEWSDAEVAGVIAILKGKDK